MKILRSISNEIGIGKYTGPAFAESLCWSSENVTVEKVPPVMVFWYQLHEDRKETYAVITKVELTQWLMHYPLKTINDLIKNAVEGLSCKYKVLVPAEPRLMQNILPVSIWKSLKRMELNRIKLPVRHKATTFMVVRLED